VPAERGLGAVDKEQGSGRSFTSRQIQCACCCASVRCLGGCCERLPSTWAPAADTQAPERWAAELVMAATAGVEGRNLLVPVDDAEVMPAGFYNHAHARQPELYFTSNLHVQVQHAPAALLKSLVRAGLRAMCAVGAGQRVPARRAACCAPPLLPQFTETAADAVSCRRCHPPVSRGDP